MSSLAAIAAMPNVIFLNRYFHPDHSATSRILSDVAFGLAEKGVPVHVISSRQRYDSPSKVLPMLETVRGIDVHRVWTSRFGRHNLFGRAIDYLTFYFSAGWTLWNLARHGDIAVAKTDPPMLSVIVLPIVRFRRAKLVNWLQDVFPEVAEALPVGRGTMRDIAFRGVRLFRDRSFEYASMNVVIGERMEARVIDAGVDARRIRVIPNFADGELIRPVPKEANTLRSGWGLSDKFVVSYSGNLGRAHEYKTLLEAMQVLSGPQRVPEAESTITSPAGSMSVQPIGTHREARSAGEIAWLFIGGGALYGELKRKAALRQLRNVRFEPYQPDDTLAESLSAADVHIVSLLPELEGLIVPSKFYGICAAGRPTIFIGDPDGEIARLIGKHGCGCAIAVGDGATLAQTIREFVDHPETCGVMGERARRAFEAEFDKSIAIARWEKLLREVAAFRANKPPNDWPRR
jgi:colanic acid biosynthesis glycosyl transferase WcaI